MEAIGPDYTCLPGWFNKRKPIFKIFGKFLLNFYSDIDMTILREGSEMETLMIVRKSIEANRLAAKGSLKLIVNAKVCLLLCNNIVTHGSTRVLLIWCKLVDLLDVLNFTLKSKTL